MIRRHPRRDVPARDLRPGDLLDLEDDPYADPPTATRGPWESLFATEFATVCRVERGRIWIEGAASYEMPPDHLVRLYGRDEEYDRGGGRSVCVDGI